MLRRHEQGPLRSFAVIARFGVDLLTLLPRLFGVYPRECNICGRVGKMLAFGQPPRFDARCRKCGSLERHRLEAMWFRLNPSTVEDKRVLHFAPESVISGILRPKARSYIGADLDGQRADTALNMENIALGDGSIDLIVCNHVLEHVDDAKALKEFHRVLIPGGMALLMFPVVEGWAGTYENPLVKGSRDRTLHFGQYDHVRYYGHDVRDRIRSAGFELTEFTAEEPEVLRLGLSRGEKIFIATKPLVHGRTS
jgi:SAM-dependent methyltransferase